MDAARLDAVTKIYQVGETRLRALDTVSLSIAEGEFTAVVGPSGSGKTTMLQMIGCLDRPDSGTVHVGGRDVTDLDADERADLRRDRIGFVFQFFALVPVLDAYENVELPLLMAGMSEAERSARVNELIQAVGLEERARHRPDQLSGGEQQRVAVARALAPRPVLVLADEPTANLDSESGRRIMEIMQRLNERTGTAFVFATHDPRVVDFARRVVEMRDGRVVGERAGGATARAVPSESAPA